MRDVDVTRPVPDDGWTIPQLAAAAGVNPITVRRLIAGDTSHGASASMGVGSGYRVILDQTEATWILEWFYLLAKQRVVLRRHKQERDRYLATRPDTLNST